MRHIMAASDISCWLLQSKNGIRIEIDFFRMEIILISSSFSKVFDSSS